MDAITASVMCPHISHLLSEAEKREAEDVLFDMEARARGYVPEQTVNLTEAIDAICSEMCGDGWDWHNRAEAVVKTVAEMCGAKVVDK